MPLIRSLFFAPANRPDLVAKFPRMKLINVVTVFFLMCPVVFYV